MHKSLHKFYFDAIARARVRKEIYGYAMFNHLVDIRPAMAENIRGTDKDPSNVVFLNSPVWDKFVSYIERMWYQ